MNIALFCLACLAGSMAATLLAATFCRCGALSEPSPLPLRSADMTHPPGQDTPYFQKPRVIKCGEHEIGCARAQRGGPKEVMRLFEDLDLALGRDELGITRSPWAPPLDCCVSGAPLFRN